MLNYIEFVRKSANQIMFIKVSRTVLNYIDVSNGITSFDSYFPRTVAIKLCDIREVPPCKEQTHFKLKRTLLLRDEWTRSHVQAWTSTGFLLRSGFSSQIWQPIRDHMKRRPWFSSKMTEPRFATHTIVARSSLSVSIPFRLTIRKKSNFKNRRRLYCKIIMPTTAVFKTPQAEQDFWAAYEAQQTSAWTIFRLDEEEIRIIKRITGSGFHPRSLYTKVEKGMAPRCMPTKKRLFSKFYWFTDDTDRLVGPQELIPPRSTFNSPLEDLTVYHCSSTELDNDYSGTTNLQRFSKFHDRVIDKASYSPLDKAAVSRPQPSPTNEDVNDTSGWFKRNNCRLRKTGARQ